MWNILPLAWKAGIILATVLALAGTGVGIVMKIRHDAVVAERAKVEAEKREAIQNANEVRDKIRARCLIDPATCVPDSWFRD